MSIGVRGFLFDISETGLMWTEILQKGISALHEQFE